MLLEQNSSRNSTSQKNVCVDIMPPKRKPVGGGRKGSGKKKQKVRVTKKKSGKGRGSGKKSRKPVTNKKQKDAKESKKKQQQPYNHENSDKASKKKQIGNFTAAAVGKLTPSQREAVLVYLTAQNSKNDDVRRMAVKSAKKSAKRLSGAGADRKMSGYAYFVSQNYKEIEEKQEADNGSKPTLAEVNAELNQNWKAFSDAERQEYKKDAANAKPKKGKSNKSNQTFQSMEDLLSSALDEQDKERAGAILDQTLDLVTGKKGRKLK